MLRALAAGETDPHALTRLAQRSLKRKEAELLRALDGQITSAQRWVLTELLDQYDDLEGAIARVEKRLDEEIAQNTDPFAAEAVALLQTLPGVARRAAIVIIAEIGLDMKRFPTAGHLASWAGVCPGNHVSAGRRTSSQTTKGNSYLGAILVQAAWAASHTKKTYLSAQYHRFAKRMGRKKALVAVAHSLLVMIYHMLSRHEPQRELGGDYFDRRNVEQQQRRLIRRLESLGLKVTVEPLSDAA